MDLLFWNQTKLLLVFGHLRLVFPSGYAMILSKTTILFLQRRRLLACCCRQFSYTHDPVFLIGVTRSNFLCPSSCSPIPLSDSFLRRGAAQEGVEVRTRCSSTRRQLGRRVRGQPRHGHGRTHRRCELLTCMP